MIIQDSIRELVLPRIDKLVKQNVVLGTSDGKILTTALGIAMSVDQSQVNFHLKMKYSYAEECVAELSKVTKRSDKFPILIINAKGVKYDGDVVTIPEMMLATWTVQEYKAADRDIKTIKPILSILSAMLEDSLREFFGVESGFNLKAEIIYNGLNPKLNLSDKVDAILFTNTKLRILKNCKQ